MSVLEQIRKKPVCIKNVLHHSHGILIGCYVLVITDKVTKSVVCNKAKGGQADHYDSHCDLQILLYVTSDWGQSFPIHNVRFKVNGILFNIIMAYTQ